MSLLVKVEFSRCLKMVLEKWKPSTKVEEEIYDGKTILSDVVVSKFLSDPDQSHLCHFSLGNMSFQGMSEISRRGLLGEKNIVNLEFYEDCVYGKEKRVRLVSGIHTMKGPIDYVHSDL